MINGRIKTYDVIIVGAGLAGCAAAALLGRQGFTVALIERKTDLHSYKKMCTHYIQAGATPAIQRLGIADKIEAAGGVRNRAAIWTRWGSIHEPAEPTSTYGYNIRRLKLDPIVRELASHTPGVDLMLGSSVTNFLEKDGRVHGVSLLVKGEEKTLTSRLVIAADGRHSFTARRLSAPERIGRNSRFGIYTYYRGLPDQGTVSQFWFLDSSIAYVFPNDDGIFMVAAFIPMDHLAQWKADWEGSFKTFMAALPSGPKLEGAQRVGNFIPAINMDNIKREKVHRGVAFIGDSATAADPVWGVGCGWAFQSAEWLVESVSKPLSGEGDLDQAFDEYKKMCRYQLQGHEEFIWKFSAKEALGVDVRLVFAAAAKDRKLATQLYRFAKREGRASEFLSFRTLISAVLVNLNQ